MKGSGEQISLDCTEVLSGRMAKANEGFKGEDTILAKLNHLFFCCTFSFLMLFSAFLFPSLLGSFV
jgi:hypothetical protein